MGVAKKGCRRIVCDGMIYSWRVGEDDDSPYAVLKLLFEGKQLILTCPLGTAVPYVISKGRLFQNQPASGCDTRYRLPFAVPKAVTPRFVSALIAWATKETGAIQISWDGREIPV